MKTIYTFILAAFCVCNLFAQGTLDSGLVAHYPFNGNANDESGNSNHGTVNSATLTTDRFGNTNKAFSFDGVNNYIDIGNNSILKLDSNNVSIVAWVNITANGSQFGRILIGGLVNNAYSLTKYDGADDRILWRPIIEGQTSTYGEVSSLSPLSRNTWHMVVAMYDGNSASLYIDGMLNNQVGGLSGNLAVHTYNAQIGGEDHSGTTSAFGGKLDDIRIYNRALIQSEITELYYDGMPEPPVAISNSRCGSGTVTLSASGAGAGNVYNWYNTPTDPTVLYTDADYTTPVLTQTDTFYVAVDSLGFESERVPAIAFIFSPGITVTDTINKFIHDGRDCQNYPIVKIGNQWWMAENLNAAKYRDGSVIPNVTNASTWSSLSTGAKCYYNNDTSLYAGPYGSLYNWFAVTDTRGVCPSGGWSVSTNSEWNIMEKFLDSTVDTSAVVGGIGTNIGGKLKEAGTIHWNSPNTGATNSSGFSALPGGNRNDVATFSDIRYGGNWWSATEYDVTNVWSQYLSYGNSQGGRGLTHKKYGFSIRCVLNTCTDVAVTIDTTICHGSTVTIGSNTYDSTGSYVDTLLTALGCDSIITTNLTVIDIADIGETQMIPLNGLVGYWPFNGNANDESGNGNNGIVNGATLTTDRFGNANSAYNSTDLQNINIPSSSSLNSPENELTIAFWMKIIAYEPTHHTSGLIRKCNDYGVYIAFDNNSIAFGTDYIGTINPNDLLNSWHHLIVTYKNLFKLTDN